MPPDLLTIQSALRRPTRRSALEPITVSVTTAKHLLNVGNTKFWALVKAGKVELVTVGRSRMVAYRSLKALVGDVT